MTKVLWLWPGEPALRNEASGLSMVVTYVLPVMHTWVYGTFFNWLSCRMRFKWCCLCVQSLKHCVMCLICWTEFQHIGEPLTIKSGIILISFITPISLSGANFYKPKRIIQVPNLIVEPAHRLYINNLYYYKLPYVWKVLEVTSSSSHMCLTPCEQIIKSCCKFLSVNCWYWLLNDFFKFFFCVYYLLTSIHYFEYLHDSISNHIWKIGSGLFSSLLTTSQNQSQHPTLSTQSTSWKFCIAIMFMVSNKAVLWLHVQMTFYTQSQIVLFKFFEFVIHDHVSHYLFFVDYIKFFCVVVLLDDLCRYNQILILYKFDWC